MNSGDMKNSLDPDLDLDDFMVIKKAIWKQRNDENGLIIAIYLS